MALKQKVIVLSKVPTNHLKIRSLSSIALKVLKEITPHHSSYFIRSNSRSINSKISQNSTRASIHLTEHRILPRELKGLKKRRIEVIQR